LESWYKPRRSSSSSKIDLTPNPSPYEGEGNRKVLISSSMRIKKVMKILFCLNSYHVLNPTPLLTKEREIGRGCFYDEAL